MLTAQILTDETAKSFKRTITLTSGWLAVASTFILIYSPGPQLLTILEATIYTCCCLSTCPRVWFQLLPPLATFSVLFFILLFSKQPFSQEYIYIYIYITFPNLRMTQAWKLAICALPDGAPPTLRSIHGCQAREVSIPRRLLDVSRSQNGELSQSLIHSFEVYCQGPDMIAR